MEPLRCNTLACMAGLREGSCRLLVTARSHLFALLPCFSFGATRPITAFFQCVKPSQTRTEGAREAATLNMVWHPENCQLGETLAAHETGGFLADRMTAPDTTVDLN